MSFASVHTYYIHIMIQRSLLRQSRAFCAKSRYTPTTSLIRSQVTPLRTRSLQERIAVRYYTSTDTLKDDASSDAAAAEASQSEIKDGDPVKKDLESKNKEIIDLKVRSKLRELHCYLLSGPHTFDM